jgi:hypothetical protein
MERSGAGRNGNDRPFGQKKFGRQECPPLLFPARMSEGTESSERESSV